MKKFYLAFLIFSILLPSEILAGRFGIKPLGQEDRATSRSIRHIPPRQVHKRSMNQRRARFSVPRRQPPLAALKKPRPVRRHAALKPRMQGRAMDRKHAVRQVTPRKKVIHQRDIGRKTTPRSRSPRSVVMPDKRWCATFITETGIIIRRTPDSIKVINRGRYSSGRELKCPKGVLVNGKRLKHNINLSVKQTPDQFKKEIAKLDKIRTTLPR